MACTDTDFLTVMLRVIIDDLETPPVYNSEKLLKILGVSTKLVLSEVRLDIDYTATIDLNLPSLDVCPEVSDALCSLIVLKAACLMDGAMLRSEASMDGVRASCGPVVMQKSAGGRILELLMSEGPCQAFKELKEKIEFTDRLASGEYFKAVIGPFISNTYWCQSCSSYGGPNCGCAS